jgi:hypothetical protein
MLLSRLLAQDNANLSFLELVKSAKTAALVKQSATEVNVTHLSRSVSGEELQPNAAEETSFSDGEQYAVSKTGKHAKLVSSVAASTNDVKRLPTTIDVPSLNARDAGGLLLLVEMFTFLERMENGIPSTSLDRLDIFPISTTNLQSISSFDKLVLDPIFLL